MCFGTAAFDTDTFQGVNIFISGIDPLELLHIPYLVYLCDVT